MIFFEFDKNKLKKEKKNYIYFELSILFDKKFFD